jgi:hypothetical protein
MILHKLLSHVRRFIISFGQKMAAFFAKEDPSEPPCQNIIDFHMYAREVSDWCWAAVAVSISCKYRPSTCPEQCGLAETVLQKADCCTDKEVCNETREIGDALIGVGHDQLPPVFSDITWERVAQEVCEGRVIACKIFWMDSLSTHAVVITGAYINPQTGEQSLIIKDPNPLYAPGETVTTHSDFINAYKGTGIWVETNFIRI